MREIKFRAWDDTIFMMHMPLTIEQIAKNNFSQTNWYQLKLMQYTGLKDKNGKEIYEGDVLSDGEYILGYVAFDDGGISWLSGSFFLSEKSDDGNHYASDAAFEDEYKPENWKETEVIGNVYENPELLS